ncbi:hypothetical protein BCR33DRAFT_714008 [Rhizoclosmatium globosum]|uniref:Uncharacterized protein n=1 Tax=Rhizoclosmatium globosum TaxID=329046 RepID=A0A1Y2CPE0_9FUNG|nr:hypothetical protein BCR33DRAFT_714008 [Rhizoclosmatium globosum]|eukprot:ORY48898.1 hypothetical protein BCR33DRAFT_714008 [Rhizoclosmatium globosum]
MADHHHSLTSTDGLARIFGSLVRLRMRTASLRPAKHNLLFMPSSNSDNTDIKRLLLATFVVGATSCPVASNRRLSLVQSLNPLLIARWINHIANDLDTANARARSVSLSPSKQMPFSNPMNLPMDQKKSGKRPAPRSLLNPRVKIRETKDTAFVSDDEDD